MDGKHAWIRGKKKKVRGKRGLRLTALMLCFCLLVTANPNMPYTIQETASVFAAEVDLKNHTSHSGWKTWSQRNVNGSDSGAGSYYLTEDITFYSSSLAMTIKSGTTVNLCLNGHTLSEYPRIKVESGATLNICDCQGESCGAIISKSESILSGYGTVNLYGGKIIHQAMESHVNSRAIVLFSGAHLLVDGEYAELGVVGEGALRGSPVLIDIREAGASAEIKNGTISSDMTKSEKGAFYIVSRGTVTISGGTFITTKNEDQYNSCIYTAYEDGAVTEINGGTINASLRVDKGTLLINNTKINGTILNWGGTLKLQNGQSIQAEKPERPSIEFDRGKPIELTSALASQDAYTIQGYGGKCATSQYPFPITKNFSQYMSGKNPADYFTYLSSGDKWAHYKVILSNGEAALLPYVMTFDANGGTLEDSDDYYNNKYTITGGKGDITGSQYMQELPKPTREGYSFAGWYTQKTGGEEVTIDNEPVDKDITVYAHWTPTIYNITYTLNGGALPSGKTNPGTYTIESAAFTLNNPTRTGYTFAGWSGTGLTGSANKTVTVAEGSLGERAYTANWSAANYSVTLNGNGGSAGTALTSYTYGTGVALPTNWTKTGYTFEGWYDNSSLTGSKVTGISETDMGNKTFYAKWTPVNYTITYNLNGGALPSGRTNPGTYTIESEPFTLNNPTRTGYTFNGWSGTGLTGSANKTVTVTQGSKDNRTYTANWTAEKYTITYEGLDGAALTTKPERHTYGSSTTVGNPTKAGYEFAGWKVNNSSTAAKNLTLSAEGYTSDITLAATWTANTYKVTFDYQGATGGNSTADKNVTYNGTYGTLPAPERAGYAFKGWYTQTGGGGSRITDTTAVKITAAQTLYAYWLDETKPDAPILKSGTTLPADWTNTQKTIPLTLKDSVGVTELQVSIDGGTYGKVTGFTSGTSYDYPVQEGSHTYRFKAKDAAGNTSEESALFTVKLDTVKPVIGTLVFENRAENLHEWMKTWVIGKTKLTITVPVTESGSGVSELKCVMTPFDAEGSPDASKAETKMPAITNGSAKVSFPRDFKGTLVLSCTDKAGNTSDSKTAGTDGVIVEDTAPVITLDAGADYYETAPDVHVTVKDDGNNAIAAGIASVKYKIDSGAEKTVTVNGSGIQTSLSFTIPAAEFSTGVQKVVVSAADNAGNTAGKTITVKIKGPEKKPEARIGYADEKLTNLSPEGEYTINGSPAQADGEGLIALKEDWLGTALTIVKPGNGETTLDSEPQELNIPARPETPAPAGVKESGVNKRDGKLTGLNAGTAYQISTDNGVTWTEAEADGTGTIEKLAPGSYLVRLSATDASFRSNPSQPAEVGAGPVTITFLASGQQVEAVTIDYGSSLAQVPAVPEKEGYTGAWNKELSQLANVRENVTVEAVYTIKTYRMTVPSDQTGYSLKPADGYGETVEHGGTYVLDYALAKGFSETESFAVKANGESVTLEDGKLVLKNITEDTELTVEGVADITPPVIKIGGNPAADNAAYEGEQSLTVEEEWLAGVTLNGTDITEMLKEKGSYALSPSKEPQTITAADESGNTASRTVTISAKPVTITFLVEGKELESFTIDYGSGLAEMPAVPEKEGYTGAWDTDISQLANVKADTTVQAVYTIKTYRITVPSGQNGYSLKPAEGYTETAEHGRTYVLYYALAEGFSETESFVIKANGKPVTAEDGKLVLKNITEDTELTVEGVADITPPEAEIVLGENKWKTLLNKITFGLFFNKTQTVTITAKDRDESLQEIYYYLADSDIENPAAITDWQPYTDIFSIEPGKYVVYAKAVDLAGNIVMLNSEGVVVDTTAPVIKIGRKQAENNAVYEGEQTLAVEEEWLESVTLNGADITEMLKGGGSCTLTPAEGSQTITAVDKAGNISSCTVTISDIPDVPDTPDKPSVPENPAAPDNSENPGNPEPPAPENPERTPENRGGLPENKRNPEDKETPEDREIAAAEPEQEKAPDNETVPDRNKDGKDMTIVPAVMEGDKLMISGETVTTGNIGNTANSKTVLEVGRGAVIVTVVCEEKEYAAGVADTVAVANAVLSPEQKKQAKNGETVEVEIIVKDISARTPKEDKNVVEKGMKELKKDIKDLTLGAYVDISMAVRVGKGSWETIAATKEPIEIVVEISKELQEKGRKYYIIRSHEGEYAFLEDIDEEQETITVSTDRFSTYAIAYQQADSKAEKCGLCHLCPTFLGICYFVWLAVLLAAVVLVLAVSLKKRKEKEK